MRAGFWAVVSAAVTVAGCVAAPPAYPPGPPIYTKVIPPHTSPLPEPTASALALEVLSLHNRERARLGIAPLQWDARLASASASYARELARLGTMRHSTNASRPNQGENLWMGTRRAFSVDEMVGGWLAERASFRRGNFPNVSRTGRWSDVGHYTQMIWRSTTHVGCGLASSPRSDFLVCRYSPAGNYRGEPVY